MRISPTFDSAIHGTVTADGYTCEWFRRCGQPAHAFVSHPVLDWVPTCERCITKLESM